MQVKMFPGYPDFMGRRKKYCGSGAGPTSYSQTTGDVVSNPEYDNYWDDIYPTAQDSTGTYYAQPRPTLAGPLATWSLHWFVVATGAEVANTVNLSTYNLIVTGVGGP